MKKLLNKIKKYFFEKKTKDESNIIFIIPKYFPNKKEQQIFIRQTKNFIIENTKIKKVSKTKR